MNEQEHSEIQNKLVEWFEANKRDLPWRKAYSPYEIWISEIMLQQTQIKTVLPYFERWMAKFPDIASVAASEEEVLKSWEGLGYYSRAKNMHKTAQILVQAHGGEIPRDFSSVLSLPGIGRYTAGAIMSFAFNEAHPIVEANIERVIARVFNLAAPVKTREAQDFIWKKAEELLPRDDARRFNQALMELGAIVCMPKNPLCPQCPINSCCKSFELGLVDQRPVLLKRKSTTPIEVAIGVLVRKGKIFIQKRPASGLMPNLWEFPGGKVNAGENPEEALVREFREELGAAVKNLEKITVIRHSYTSFRVTLHAYYCEPEDEKMEPILRAAVDSRWVERDELNRYAFPAANRKLIDLL